MTQQYRINYRVLNGVLATNELSGELEERDLLLTTAPMSAEEAQQTSASLELDDDIENIEIVKA